MLANAFGSIDALLEASEEDVDDVEEIGPEIARSVHAWFADKANRKLIEKLRAAGVRMKDQAPKRPRGKQPLVARLARLRAIGVKGAWVSVDSSQFR